MTLEEFEIKFKKRNRSESYYYNGLCFLFIGISIYFLNSIVTGGPITSGAWKKTAPYLASILFFFVGVYGLYVLRSAYKLSFWYNELSKEENMKILKVTAAEFIKKEISFDDNYTRFVYGKGWWSLPFEVHLFADSNVIAIHVKGIDQSSNGGFIDFGASKRAQNKILSMITEKAGL